MPVLFSSRIPAYAASLLIISAVLATNAHDLKHFLFESENPVRKKNDIRKQRLSAGESTALHAQGPKLVEILQQVWEQGAWADSGKILIVYDGDTDTAVDYYVITNGTWTHDEHVRYTYTPDDSINDAYSQKWVADSSKWLDYYQEMFSYHATQGYLTEDYIKLSYPLFDPDNADLYPSGLTDYQKTLNVYNSDRQVTEITIQEVLTMDYVLADSKRARYTYDANKNITQYTLQQYVSSAWTDSMLTLFTYNAKNQIVKDSICNYRRSNRTWVPYSKHTVTYTSFDSLESVTLKRYRSLLWADTLRVLYEYYDNTKLELKSTLQEWSADSGSWLNVSSDSLIYTGEDIREDTYKEYLDNAWVNKDRVVYNYETAAIHPARAKGAEHSSFSVTTIPDGKIRVVLHAASVVSATVYDLQGNVLKTLESQRRAPAGVHTLSWDGKSGNGSDAAPGLYFYRVTINNQIIPIHTILLK